MKQTDRATRSANHLSEEVNEYRGAYRVRNFKKMANRLLRRAKRLFIKESE